MIELSVDLGSRSYPIYIGQDVLSGPIVPSAVRGKQALIVTNETIAPLYRDRLSETLSGKELTTLVLPDGERYKTLEYLAKIFDALIENKHDRTTTLVALGGGVIGDMTGYAAASYQRGVDFIQVPTTLLAQVDSSVGGKTAVNHPQGKNMIGAFYQPQAVFIDTDTLSSLPEREFAAGMAEVIKYGLIADPEFLTWLEDNMAALLSRDMAAVGEAIRISCQTKASIVARDETEQGVRAILNLGHTFGHAVEAAQHYRDWLHGEAVAAGMVMAARFSQQLGWLEPQHVDRVCTLIERAGLPTHVPSTIGTESFLSYMGLDKKVLNGKLRLVLLKALGSAVVTDEFPSALLRELIENTQDS